MTKKSRAGFKLGPQASRLLEAARKGGADQNKFRQAMGKVALRQNGRKTAKGGVGGGAE